MVMLAFGETKMGQVRQVVRELVGGRALRTRDQEGRPEVQVWSWYDVSRGGMVDRLVAYDVAASVGDKDQDPGFPPDGGVGGKATARWPWYAKEDDEVLFPKGAQITEIEDENGEWWFGVYMSKKGVLPAPYVRLTEGEALKIGI